MDRHGVDVHHIRTEEDGWSWVAEKSLAERKSLSVRVHVVGRILHFVWFHQIGFAGVSHSSNLQLALPSKFGVARTGEE